ncbi:MAG: PA2778 family cysteine peptidase [Alphaproteobacteria bacterium]|nr:PA2778 family cysteine peptidase [Alphaproteobacteria bacterium]
MARIPGNRRKRAPVFTVLAVAWAVLGCAPGLETLPPPATQDLPRRVEIADVPFFPQEDYQCGPASLAIALTHGGVAVRPRDLVGEVYSPARKGSLAISMLASARRRGLLAFPLSRLDRVMRELAGGTPAIVLQRLGPPWARRWHFAVLIGYDLERQEMILRSGRTRRLVMPFDEFAATWAPGQNWALVVLPPSRLPESAEERTFVAAVFGLERARQFPAAVTGYETALSRWPRSLGAMVGLGNSHYAVGDLAAAVAAFERATVAHPTSAVAFNNLAHVLAEMGRRDEAVPIARKAVALGGPFAALSKTTLREIERGR